MSKFTFLFLAALTVLAMAVPAMATDTRQASLAGVGNFIEDDFNIFMWPATLTSYSNMVWIGIQNLQIGEGTQMFYYMGASYGLGAENKHGTIGLFLFDFDRGLNPFTSDAWPGSGVFNDIETQKWTLFYAYPMDKLSFGIYLNRDDSGEKDDTGVGAGATSTKFHDSYTTVGASIRFDMGDKAYCDLGADVSSVGYLTEHTPTYGTIKQDARLKYSAQARIFYQWKENFTWVPFVSFQHWDFSEKADSAAAFALDNWGDKATMVEVGLGTNIKVNENNLLIFAFEPIVWVKREPSSPPAGVTADVTETVIPRMYLALESDVKSWLTFRAGAVKTLYKEADKDETATTRSDITYTDANFAFYMGLGFHVGDFDIDALLNNEVPLHLGYWLTGYTPSNQYELPMTMLTATYHW